MKWSACPRCDDANIVKISDSPKLGVWEVYRCRRCNYVWRSTEKLDHIEKYDQGLVDAALRRPDF